MSTTTLIQKWTRSSSSPASRIPGPCPSRTGLDMALTGIKTPLGMKYKARMSKGSSGPAAQIQHNPFVAAQCGRVFAEHVAQGFYIT